jgi:DNA-binding beta-propeller fold protein YncE
MRSGIGRPVPGGAHAHAAMTAFVAAAALVSCARAPVSAPALTPVVWPAPPAPPRIRFERTFAQPKDLGITTGFFGRVRELLTGRSEARLVRPMAVVAERDGALYVADPGVEGVHRFDPERRRYDLIRQERGEPLPSPVGLALGPARTVYVADSRLRRVLRIAGDSRVATPVPLAVGLDQPTGIAVDPTSGRLYVLDTGSHQVKVFEAGHTFAFAFGRRGTGDGELNYPTAIWRDQEGRLLVADALNFRVQLFDAEGRFLAKFGQPGDATGYFSRPKGVAVDRSGHVYVVDALFHAVQIFTPSGDLLLHFGGQGHGPGEFWLPAGIFVAETGAIYVADAHNRRVQVFRAVGGL